MPQKLETLLAHTERLPKNQSDLLFEFKQYKEDNDASPRNIKNFFLVLNLFARHLEGKSLQDVTKDDVLLFLNSRKKTPNIDSVGKWRQHGMAIGEHLQRFIVGLQTRMQTKTLTTG